MRGQVVDFIRRDENSDFAAGLNGVSFFNAFERGSDFFQFLKPLDVLVKSVAAGARVELERLPGQGFCLDCGETVPVMARYDACPKCGGYQVQATGGTEMRVKDLLVE